MNTSNLIPRNVRLIAINEMRQRYRSKAFRIGFAVMAVMIAVGATLPGLLSKDPKLETRQMAIVGADVPDIVRPLLVVKFDPVADRAKGVELVKSGKVVGLVTPTELIVRSGIDFEVDQLVQQLHVARVLGERAKANGVNDSQADALLKPISPLTITQLDKKDDVDSKAVGLASVTQVLLLLAISLFGTTVLNGVLQEKASRVVEVVLATVTTRQLLAGKLLGIGSFAVAQVIALSALGLVLVSRTSGTSLPTSTTPTIFTFIVCFLFGFAFYSALFAAAGALASRIEDAQSVATPVSLLLTAGYGVATAVSVSPNTLFAKIMTYVPPAAPSVVIARVASGRIHWWEMMLSALIMVLSIVVVVRFAARVYSGAALRIGAKVKLRDALRNAER
jgi:ABC-2 type transport system permease protein